MEVGSLQELQHKGCCCVWWL